MKLLAEAQRDVLSSTSRLAAEPTSLWKALGLVLVDDVVAPHDVPPFPNSAMDGYAVRYADVRGAPVSLPVLEDVAAGHVAAGEVRPGSAIKIMTGAPLPVGADTVVPVEDTTPGEGTVTINVVPEFGASVRHAGGDVAAGTLVFEAGTQLTPPHLGSLATMGIHQPVVFRRPRVAIMSTGDEVQPPDTGLLHPGWIRDSNRPLLTALLTEAGVEVIDLGIVRDDAERLREALMRAVDEADVILTSGGVSMGEYDLVKQILTELGDIELWRVAMQPAKPFAFGKIKGTPLFGLPGNPVSVLVAFEQFARPALLTMMGAKAVFRRRSVGRLAEPVDTDPAKTVFLRVRVEDGEPPLVRLAGGQQSNVLSAAAAADAFGVVPVGVADLPEGADIILEWFRLPATRSASEVLGD